MEFLESLDLGMLIIITIGMSMVIGFIGMERKIGFVPALLSSLFLTPLFGLIITLSSPTLESIKRFDNIIDLLKLLTQDIEKKKEIEKLATKEETKTTSCDSDVHKKLENLKKTIDSQFSYLEKETKLKTNLEEIEIEKALEDYEKLDLSLNASLTINNIKKSLAEKKELEKASTKK